LDHHGFDLWKTLHLYRQSTILDLFKSVPENLNAIYNPYPPHIEEIKTVVVSCDEVLYSLSKRCMIIFLLFLITLEMSCRYRSIINALHVTTNIMHFL
jgi:hypothetical protein